MNSASVVLDYWRNYKPVVPETIPLKARQFTETAVDLRPYIVQGAREPNGDTPSPDVLDKVPVQRGWRLAPLIINQPDNGKVRLSEDQETLLYMPNNDFLGEDCFNIRLTNGTQQSDAVRIMVEVQKYLRVWLTTYKKGADTFIFRENHEFPKGVEGLKSPYCYLLRWYWTRPVAIWNEARQANEIHMVRSLVLASTWYTYFMAFMPVITQQRRLELKMPTDEALRGFDGNTSRLYQPTGTRGIITLECDTFSEYATYVGLAWSYSYVDMSRPVKIKTETPPNWWESGNVLPASAEPRL